MELHEIPNYLVNNLQVVWTFLLLVTRFGALMVTLPGIGLGDRGTLIRIPAAMAFAFASLDSHFYAHMPQNWFEIVIPIFSEMIVGGILGLIPFLIISGVQLGSQIGSTTMGLGVSTLIDPTSGGQVADLARIFGDLSVLLFLTLGGHYAVIYAASGAGGEFIPGTLFMNDFTVTELMNKTSHVFTLGVLVSAPMVVALLLTQFVMGLISKAVPTVNIFIISFPLTIGIGLVLAAMTIPELLAVLRGEFNDMGASIPAIMESMSGS